MVPVVVSEIMTYLSEHTPIEGCDCVYDIKVPPYLADRYNKRFGKKLCEITKNPLKSRIEITTRSKFTGTPTVTKCSCLELLGYDD